MTSLTGRLRRTNGSVKTASQPRSRRPIGIHWRAINISCEKTKGPASNHGAAVHGDLPSSSITLTLVATVLVVTHFRAEVMAYVARYAGHEDKLITEQESRSANQGSLISNSVALQRAEADQTTAPAEAQQAARVQQAAVVSVPEAQLSLKADRAGALSQEPDEIRRAIEGLDVQRWAEAEAAQSARSLEEEGKKAAALALEVTAARKELTASTAQHRQAMDEERARSAALASELETTRREIETQAAQSQKAFGEAVQQKQAAEAAIAQLQQSLQQEQKKTTALMQEAKAAQATMTAAEPQRRALDEAQARAAALASELAREHSARSRPEPRSRRRPSM